LERDTNDGFIDIDELLSGIQERNVTSKGTAEKMKSGFKSGSSATFSQPFEENTQGEHTLFSNLAATSY
jgi:hypothetical protein